MPLNLLNIKFTLTTRKTELRITIENSCNTKGDQSKKQKEQFELILVTLKNFMVDSQLLYGMITIDGR